MTLSATEYFGIRLLCALCTVTAKKHGKFLDYSNAIILLKILPRLMSS